MTAVQPSITSKRHRLNLLTYTDATLFGGAEQSLGNLLGDLGPHLEVGVLGTDRHVVEAIAARRPGASAQVLPVVRGKGDVRAIRAHVRALRSARPQVFHANLKSTWSCWYGIVAAVTTPGVRCVTVDQLPLAAEVDWWRPLRRYLMRRVDANVAVGERAACMVEQFVGLPAGSVLAIHNGVPDVALEPIAPPRSGLILGSLGRLVPQKGFDLLVRALPNMPEATAVLVGDGPERPLLESLAAELGVNERLVITGWTAEPRRHLGYFDVFVLPSRYEGFPLAIIEAMLAGRAVVAADVGSVSESVIDGETGILIPPEDASALTAALNVLLADREVRRRMGARGRGLASERFTSSVMARGYERLYEEVVRN